MVWPSLAPLLLLLAMSASPEHVGFESEECNDAACTYRVSLYVEIPFDDMIHRTTRADDANYKVLMEALEHSQEVYRCRTLYPAARGYVDVTAMLDRDLASHTWSARLIERDAPLTTLLAWPTAPVPSSELAMSACIKAEIDHQLREHPLRFDLPYRVAFPDYSAQCVPDNSRAKLR